MPVIAIVHCVQTAAAFRAGSAHRPVRPSRRREPDASLAPAIPGAGFVPVQTVPASDGASGR